MDQEYDVFPREAGGARYSRGVSPAIETIGGIASGTGARPLDQAVFTRFERLIICVAVSSSLTLVNLYTICSQPR